MAAIVAGPEFQLRSWKRTVRDYSYQKHTGGFSWYCVTMREGRRRPRGDRDPRTGDRRGNAVVAETYHKLRKHKGVSEEAARENARLPHFFGALMVRAWGSQGEGMVAAPQRAAQALGSLGDCATHRPDHLIRAI